MYTLCWSVCLFVLITWLWQLRKGIWQLREGLWLVEVEKFFSEKNIDFYYLLEIHGASRPSF